MSQKQPANQRMIMIGALAIISCTIIGASTLHQEAPIERKPQTQYEAAISRAQDSLDYFVTVLKDKKPAQYRACIHLAAKDGKTQPYWVTNVYPLTPGRFCGRLGNGQKAQFHQRQIIDWEIIEGKNRTGGFTLDIAEKPM